jgi:MFS family permease
MAEKGIFSEPKWVALWAAMLGFLLDAMDVLLYVFALQVIRSEFGLSNQQAGLVSSATLIASAIGGIVSGALSDRFGRRTMLMATILLYSFASAGTALSQGLAGLLFWRALVGLGLGGEWSAGATLVSEYWPAHQRARAIAFMQSGWALGYMAAAALTALILPTWGWRTLFVVGVLPALLTFWIRARVKEPPVWLDRSGGGRISDIFKGELGKRTMLSTLVATFTLLAYWGMFTWLPGFLSATKSAGGAGLSIVKTTGWVFLMQAGAYFGYLSFGFLADRIGRRPAFLVYVLTSAVLTPLYGLAPSFGWDWLVLGLGPLIGFFGTGYFALFGAMLAELYPTNVRGAGQGFTYNVGRGVSALAPFLVGVVADSRGIGVGLALNSSFFLLAAALIFLLPETRDVEMKP